MTDAGPAPGAGGHAGGLREPGPRVRHALPASGAAAPVRPPAPPTPRTTAAPAAVVSA
jgi:hypothetical protein